MSTAMATSPLPPVPPRNKRRFTDFEEVESASIFGGKRRRVSETSSLHFSDCAAMAALPNMNDENTTNANQTPQSRKRVRVFTDNNNSQHFHHQNQTQTSNSPAYRNKINSLSGEVKRLEAQCSEGSLQLTKLREENEVLKKAVVIQNNKIGSLEAEVNNLKNAGQELLARTARLENENYALKAHLHQLGGGGTDFGCSGGPRDVF